jgi:hypothetical protein
MMDRMNTIVFFLRNIPNLLETSSHMSWRLRIVFFKSTYVFYAKQERIEKVCKALPQIGQPALRSSCCAMKRDRFEAQKMVKDIPELVDILRPKGTAAFNKFLQCSICGQEWVEVWTHEKMSGFYQVAKN